MEILSTLAAIAWDPQIRGILAVLVGVVVLGGSVYLIVATNTGARLGLLIALAGFFGWMVIMTLYWWLLPPGQGPRGENPSWQPVEVYIEGDEPPETAELQQLPPSGELPTAEDVLADNPDVADQLVGDPVLSDIAGVAPEILPTTDELGGWMVMASSQAGEAQAAADVALEEIGLFESAAAYQRLNTFEIGGKPDRSTECEDDDFACRALYRVRTAFQITHPPHFAVVEVQPVLEQEAVPGSPPPAPVIDDTRPVVRVVLVRDLGSVRVLPATYFIISLALFIVFVLMLHYRDKTLTRNLEAAAAVEKAGTK